MLLYVGKAKNLKNRVSSYFQQGRPKNQRLTLMISQIDKVEYTVVNSEKESLLLEANLIHSLQPKYNILLKDDKSYLYVRLSAHPIPGFFLTRSKYDPHSQYFGPYTKKYGINNSLRLLRTIFPFCQEKYPQTRPCSYVGIKQCDGICVGSEDKTEYKAKLEQIKNVLLGKTKVVEDFISSKMQEAIKFQNFELAALWRDRKEVLLKTVSDQKVVLPHPQDLDLVSLVIEELDTGLQVGSVFVQQIRDGKVINVLNFLLSGTEEEPEDFESENDENKVLVKDSNKSNEVNELRDRNNELIFSFTQRFLANFYLQRNENVNIVLQTFVKGVEVLERE